MLWVIYIEDTCSKLWSCSKFVMYIYKNYLDVLLNTDKVRFLTVN